MALHLVKLAVGAASIEEIEEFIEQRRKQRRQKISTPHWVYTRNTPKRQAELLEGGSLYWVVKGYIRARQLLVGFGQAVDDEGRPYCQIRVERKVIPTAVQPMQAFQGWRYLEPARAPVDVRKGDSTDLPPAMADELRRLGLL